VVVVAGEELGVDVDVGVKDLEAGARGHKAPRRVVETRAEVVVAVEAEDPRIETTMPVSQLVRTMKL
jgi:hypothetical protein